VIVKRTCAKYKFSWMMFTEERTCTGNWNWKRRVLNS